LGFDGRRVGEVDVFVLSTRRAISVLGEIGHESEARVVDGRRGLAAIRERHGARVEAVAELGDVAVKLLDGEDVRDLVPVFRVDATAVREAVGGPDGIRHERFLRGQRRQL